MQIRPVGMVDILSGRQDVRETSCQGSASVFFYSRIGITWDMCVFWICTHWTKTGQIDSSQLQCIFNFRLTKFFQTYWIDFGGHDRIDSPWFAGVSARATNPTGEPHQIYANQGRMVYFWLIWCFMVLLHGQLSEYEDAKTMVQNKIQRSHREKSLLHSMPNDGKGIQKDEVKRMFQ